MRCRPQCPIMTQLVLGVDSSTGSTKVEARDLGSGRLVARTSADHPPTQPPVSEQDPQAWWTALKSAVHELGDLRSQVVAVSVAGQQHGLVCVDDRGDVIRPAKLWNDTTSAPQAAELVERFGAKWWVDHTCLVPVASFTITKLAWLEAHEPEALARTAKVMLPHDYLTWRLTGNHVTDRGDASGTGWFDPVAGQYLADTLAAVSPALDVDMLPTVLRPTEAAGQISAPVAVELGLPHTVIVGPGTGDNMGAALGLGLAPGDVAVSLGTSGVAYMVATTPARDVSGAVAGFADASGHYLPLVATLNATKVTNTVAQWLGTDPAGLADLAMAQAWAGTTVSLVPYFDGERSPNLPDATGSLMGLRSGTTREELALAAHDGVLCGLLDGVDALAAAVNAGSNVSAGTLCLIGGGARSVAYQQRAADLFGAPVLVPDADEMVATGAAVQAASVVEGVSVADVAKRWPLAAGSWVEPRHDASDVRPRHRDLVRSLHGFGWGGPGGHR